MRPFSRVIRAVEDCARRDPAKRDQPFAIVVANATGEVREERYAPPDTGILFLEELRAIAQQCVDSGSDTEPAAQHAPRQGHATILKTRRGVVYGAVAVAGRGSQNTVLAEYGRDIFFCRKPRHNSIGGTHGKA